MKQFQLFIREHISFVIFQILLVLFIFLLYWLDGFRNYNTAIYSIIISMLLTAGFLFAKFIFRRSFYAAITRMPSKMEDALIRHAQSPEHEQTAVFIRGLYKRHQHEVQTLYASQNRQIQFMNQWVHQMKTPISVINLLLQEEGPPDKLSIGEEVERIQRGLDTVLVNARLETFERDMQIERVELRRIVQEVVSEHKRLFIANHVFPVISIDERLLVATDVKWLKTVILQFITNAVKYTFEEGKKVHFSATTEEKNIVFTVRDEGVGIPASDLNRVTKPFFTGENGRLSGESTGMGLYIATEALKRLGHSLKIDSVQGVGTTVSILFENGESEDKDDSKHNRESK